ncbi:MAG: thioesterase family protein [Sandaracinaceae bacterium]|nr:thioesterase family protein [Sandaracinaceae bacterium]
MDAPITPDTTPFSLSLFARWPDMDFNQHMRNAAYLGASEDCRMRFLAERGFPMREFQKRGIGPVILEDKLTYKKEIKLLEGFRVELALAGSTRDVRRLIVRNTILRDADDAVAAVVQSVVLWLDLAARKPVAPPDALRDVWLGLARTSDFEWLD